MNEMRKRPVAHIRRIKTKRGYKTIVVNKNIKRVKKTRNKVNLKKLAYSLYYWNKVAKRLRDEHNKLAKQLFEDEGIPIAKQKFEADFKGSEEYLDYLKSLTPDDDEEEQLIEEEIERVEEIISNAHEKLSDLKLYKEEIYEIKENILLKYGKPTNIYHDFGSSMYAFQLYYIDKYSFHTPRIWENEVPDDAEITTLDEIPFVKLPSQKVLLKNNLLYSLKELRALI